MKITPIAARSSRWLSFVLAITLAFQFVSPLVFAAEPHFVSYFMAVDSGRENALDDTEQLDEDFAADDIFFDDLEELDSAFTLDSMPPRATRAPGTAPDWHSYVNLKASVSGADGTSDIVLDSGTTPLIPITAGATKLKIHVDFGTSGIPNSVPDLVETGEENAYEIQFSKNLVKLDVLPPLYTYKQDGVTILHARLTKESDGTPLVKIWLNEDARDKLSEIKGEYDLDLNLKPLASQNPANPTSDKLIELTDGSGFAVKPYETVSTKPELEKSVSDDTRIADTDHPIEWKLKYKTGRLTPDNVIPAYIHREIKIEDTIDPTKHTFDDAKLKLKWTSNNGAVSSVNAWSSATPPTEAERKDQTKLPFYLVENGKLIVYLPDTPNSTTTGQEWCTLTFESNVTNDYFNNSGNQGKSIDNKAKLSTGNEKTVEKTASTKLPKWIAKVGDANLIDTARVARIPNVDSDATGPMMPIAWKITINPDKAILTILKDTELIDYLPKGLWKIVSVREMTAPNTYTDLYAPIDNIGNGNKDHWMLTGTGTNLSTGALGRSANPSGTLTYTYPSAVNLFTTGADGKKTGRTQEFVVTALVDFAGLNSSGQVEATFVNKADLKLLGQTGGYGATAPKIGVSVNHSLLNKASAWDAKNRQLTWTIDVNKVNATLTTPWVGDDIQGTQKFVAGSFTVKSKAKGASGGYTNYYPGKGTLTHDSGKFDWTYDFDIAGTSTDAFQIQYKTYVPHPNAYPGGGEQKGNEPNIAVLHEAGNVLIQVEDNPAWKSSMLTKSVVKYDPTPDPDDTSAKKRRLLTWQVTVNPQGSFLETPAFADVLPEGLEYKTGTFTVKQGSSTAAAPTGGFAYNAATRELTYDFSQYRDTPSAHSVYYPNASALGIAGIFVLEFQTYVPEYLWETSKTNKDTVDYKNTARLVCANTKADASATANIKAPTISKTGASDLLSTKVNGVDIAYFEWKVDLNRNAAKLNDVTIVDELPEGLLLDYTLGSAFAPTLEAWKVVPDGNKPPKFNAKIKDIPLILGVNSFYEPNPANPNAYNLRIELDNLLAEYPDGCGFKLIYRTLPTKGGVFTNKIRLEGLGASVHEGSGSSVSISDAQASGNASGLTGRLTVKKVTVEPNSAEATAQDVAFSLSVTSNSQKIGSLVTDAANGTCLFNKLRFGGYTVTETQAPEGYWIAPPATFTVNKASSNADPTAPNLFKNYANQIIVAKKDASSRLPLAGAQFQLYTKAGTKVDDVKTTDANGECGWSKLAEGKYYIEEVAAPNGYKLSDAKKSATFKISCTDLPKNAVLTGDATKASGKYIDKTVDASWTKTPAFLFEFSNPRTGSVSVEKRDEVTNLPLTDAQFGLYKAGEAAPVESKSTDLLGKLSFDTALEDKTSYEVREQLAPEGYLMGGYTSGTFTTDFANRSAEQRLYSYSVTNVKNLVVCEKVSIANEATKLAGAVFGLYRADGTPISTSTSKADGRFSFSGIPVGAYIQEITPPAGYQLNTTRYTPGLTPGSTENPSLYTFKNNPTPPSGGGEGGGGGGGSTPLLPPKSSSSSSSRASSSSSASSNSESSSSRPLPKEDDNGQISPEGLTSDEVGRLIDEGYRPTRDVPFGLTREQVIKMILDENIPLGKLPATGDATGHIVFPLVLMAAASACITGLYITRRKKRRYS